jgi:protein AATF/BFR2
MLRPSSLRRMNQSVADTKYEGVRTSRKELMENESGEDDEESHHEEDEEESKKGRVRFDVPSEKHPWKSNGAISDDDIPSESEDGSEASQRGSRDITSHRNTPSKPSENLGPTEDVSLTLKKKREEDIEKSHAVKRQVVCFFCLRDSVCSG